LMQTWASNANFKFYTFYLLITAAFSTISGIVRTSPSNQQQQQLYSLLSPLGDVSSIIFAANSTLPGVVRPSPLNQQQRQLESLLSALCKFLKRSHHIPSSSQYNNT